ncbi:S8 family serine peptidase [Haloechinothrix halophila]|uniref:S8 family serine peptidase n=1 Tax=Haloechinothrix halophila TaxID=1069073 RepID=UPI0003F585D0|nr:S8 family serine peptidase [Haloechinothrix halophila]
MRALISIVAAFVFALLVPATSSSAYADNPDNDTAQERTWNFEQARIPGAQRTGNWGKGVTVAVIDTWVDFGHPDLKSRIAGYALCTDSASGCRDNAFDRDRCKHGTHVAGTVVSGRYGVAPDARVYAVQVLSYDPASGSCGGNSEDVARGIRFAVAKGVGVINLSLGTLVPGVFSSEAVASAVADAARAGVVVVFAAGNSTVPLSDDYGSNALLVAATGPDGEIASYSTRGGSVSLAAPGGDDGAAGLTACRPDTCIFSTVPDGAYGLFEGTSMAAPHVSGVAALLLSQDPRRGRADVVRSLQSTARPLAGTRHGLIDATAALGLRKQAPSPTATPGGTQGKQPDLDTRQRTRQPRPSPERTTPSTGVAPDNSRAATFSRDPVAQQPGDGEGTRTTEQAAPVGSPGAGQGGGSPSSGLPLTMLWGGLAAAGAITVLVAATGATQRLRRTRYDDP